MNPPNTLLRIAAVLLITSLPTNGHPQEADLKQISEENSLSNRELNAKEVFSRCESSVLRVEVDLKDGGKQIGTAFVTAISGEINILTNRHVVDGAREIRVTGSQGQPARVESYSVSDQYDLAILKTTTALKLEPLKLRTRPEILGETVYAIGFPLGLQKAVTQGILSSVYSDAIQFDAPISSGNSGGPLLDAQGEVLGIVTLGSKASSAEVIQNFNIAIPSRAVPALAAFKEPPIGFLAAWLKLVDLAADQVQLFKEKKILELLQVAQDVFQKSLGQPTLSERVYNFQSANAKEPLGALIETLGFVDKNIPEQATSAANLLRSQTAKFDAISVLFSENPIDQELQSAVDTIQEPSGSAKEAN